MSMEMEGSGACSAYEPLLEGHVNGMLFGDEAASVKRHLAECVACRASVDGALTSGDLLRELSAGAEWQMAPPPGFARITMARIRVAREEQMVERESFWQSFVFWGWRFTATAALALGLLATYDVRWGHNLQPATAVVRPTTVRDILATDTGDAPASPDDVLVMVAGTSDGSN